jgi:hypothetical protein
VNLGSDQFILQGSSATLDAGPGNSFYLWSNGATTQTISVSTDGCYSVVVTNSYGCEGTDTACVNVIQPSDLAVNAILSPQNSYCGSATAEVTVQVINYGPNAVSNVPVLATISGAASGNLSGILVGPIAANDSVSFVVGTINSSAGGIITIDAYTNYAAENNSANDHTISNVLTIQQPALPIGIDAIRCGPGILVLTASASQTVVWYDAPTGGTVVANSNTFTTPLLNQTTTYYAQNGVACINQDRAPVTATILAPPSVNLGADTIISSAITLTPQVTGTAPFTFLWSTSETSQSIVVNQTGSYSVNVTDANGCVGTDTVNVQLSVGLSGLSAENHLLIYPNPAQQAFVLKGSSTTGTTLIRIIDLRGALVYEDVVVVSGKPLSKEINIGGLAKGIYIVSVIDENQTQQIRLVIE